LLHDSAPVLEVLVITARFYFKVEWDPEKARALLLKLVSDPRSFHLKSHFVCHLLCLLQSSGAESVELLPHIEVAQTCQLMSEVKAKDAITFLKWTENMATFFQTLKKTRSKELLKIKEAFSIMTRD